MIAIIRKYLISGLLVWLPVWATFLMLRFLVELMDGSLKLIPYPYQPDQLLGFHIPGLGLIFTLVILFFTGMIAANFFGNKLIALWDKAINRIPIVRSVYSGVKQAAEAIFSSKGKAFSKVWLVEYPRKGLWSIAFETSRSCSEVSEKIGEELVTIFIPTTPNPTSGFLMMAKRSEMHELKMSTDAALKLVISLGVVHPGSKPVQEETADA